MQYGVYPQRNMENFHEKCKKHLYQFVQIELNDGSVYQGLLHSYDREKIYIIMPKMHHDHHDHHHHHHHHMTMESSDESRLFPFFGPFGLYGFPFFGVRAFGPFFPFFI
ncbi:hypothetical protein [Bacillus sp. S/N-304-OC-R1]|uniref:hypothetical protein n=1 Tax=Bacillus sp. S/N-304-OC-R1 TaxID=2758034 RepID=UPI001C8D150D|nr:hypothetical protein [Bacillus sp. S/N-304-OC-R1]MBY0121790.1 hypothetical protein [Bacillus sp. S/N-304-OC-R1]